MLIGPVLPREAIAAPRRVGFYLARTLFAAALFGLIWTSWELLVGSQRIENPGDLARFGAALFQILAPFQLAVAMPFSALLVAAAVAQEKDRQTLVLLLMTNLSNAELVLGRLLASLLALLVVLGAALPLFMLTALFGGVTYGQIFRVEVVTLLSVLVVGSLGSLMALWREKTFQALAMTTLVLVLWHLGWEIVHAGIFGQHLWIADAQAWSIAMSPWQAILAAAKPDIDYATAISSLGGPVAWYLVSASVAACVLNGVAIWRLRIWNPSRETRSPSAESEVNRASIKDQASASPHHAGGKVRHVWDNPILWREVCTWSFGKKIVLIRGAYLVMFAICAAALVASVSTSDITSAQFLSQNTRSIIPGEAKPLVPLLLVGLLLLNALAVTSLTNERDSRALDLLLVTDLSPKEIIFGKLGGAFYNAKEMILLPLVLLGYLWWIDHLTTENLLFLLCGFVVMNGFAAMLGLHAGMTYANSRHAIATSLGTMLFLFLGVSTCMRMMLALSDSFQNQLTSFLGFIVGGGVGLFAVLGWRNPSRAIFLASFLAPFATFFVITSFLLGKYGTVFLVTTITYGFATAAMLVPALAEFDIATGRASGDRKDE